MTRRIEAVRVDTTGIQSNARAAQKADVSRDEEVRRRQVDSVKLQTSRARGTETPGEAGVDDPQASTAPQRTRSPDDMLADFAAPVLPDPAILDRSISILGHCLREVVPELEGGDEIHELARTLMKEEMERHRYLLDRTQGGPDSD